MFFYLARFLTRSYLILILLTTHLVISLPVPLSKRPVDETPNTSRNGFSNIPRILEIQLPLKIATREDLVAWARYVMGLMASKINITLSTVKEPPLKTPEVIKDSSNHPIDLINQRQLSKINLSKPQTNKLDSKLSFNADQGVPNFGRIKDINSRIPFETINTFNLPQSTIKQTDYRSILDVQNSLKTKDDTQLFLPQYPDFGTRPSFDLNENDILRNASVLTPPSAMYLPLPVKTTDNLKFSNDLFATRYFFDGVERNVSNFGVTPLDLSLRLRNQENVSKPSPVKTNELTGRRNVSNVLKPILTLPFEAVITIVREEAEETATSKVEKDFMIPIREPPDEFPPYFDRNYTLTNESGQINVVLDDEGIDDEEGENNVKNENKKKENSKKSRAKKQKSRKRQSSTLGELLRMLGILRRNNTAEINTFLPSKTGSNRQKGQFEVKNEAGRGRRNETSQAQEIEDNNDDDGTNGGNSNSNTSDSYENDDDDDEEEMGGSIQALIDLLPLVAPILDDLSDPETETDISELLQAAIPLLEGLSEGDEDSEAIDIPGAIVPILMSLSGGTDGQGDSGAVLGPLIQLVAPLIGPILGPLIGPLSRQSSNPPGEGGSSASSVVQALLGPLSQPTGPGKMSPLSNLIAGVVSGLSKELTDGKSGLDLSTLVKAVVSGALAGTSAGLSGHKDSAAAPTGYGGYGGYGPSAVPANSVNPISLIGSTIKDVLNAGLKIASSLISAVTGILGASSSDKPQSSYGPPQNSYGAPPSYAAPTSAPYTQNIRPPKRQIRL